MCWKGPFWAHVIKLTALGGPNALYETGFKMFPNQLDYAAFSGPLPDPNPDGATQGRPNADEDLQCLSMPPTTRAVTSCAKR
ncbi:hypothetical protein BR1R5_32900 [Pseudomonas sp. BR1R-5]|nr:hypothetical protein BR1R5_32900 [Pseudomonas sp. BR1R-5]